MIALTVTLACLLAVMASLFGWAGLRRLAACQFRGRRFVVLACTVQLTNMQLSQPRMELLVLASILLAVFCWHNWFYVGMPLLMLGMILNFSVMAANGASMPIQSHALARLGHPELASGTMVPLTKARVLDDSQSRLSWLGDRLFLPGPLAQLAAWSIGDVLLLAGISRLLWQTMKGHTHVQYTRWERLPIR